jgi:uncharacterized membrane protein YdjX (TVP38/TMEM64 family)/rhodanese-related sulfurtransferase
VLLVVGVGAVLAWAMTGGHVDTVALEAVIEQSGGLAPLIFVGAFAVATVLLLPGSLFGLAGGVLFGPVWGTVWNVVGATLGATIAFLLARFVAGRWISARAGGRLETVVSGVEAEGWRFVALTRLVPLVPFNVLNYVLGLTRIPLSHYMLATLVCMIPGAAAFSWLGHAGRRAMVGDSAAIQYGLLGLAAVALIAFLPRLIQRLRKRPVEFISAAELQRLLGANRCPVIVDVREPHEISGPLGSIPGALNIPLGEVPGRCRELLIPESPPIVLVCRTERRSEKAAALLRGYGVPNVAVLRGGMEGWAAHT